MYLLSFFIILVQLEGGHFQEQTQEYARWKELRDRLAADLRLSVSTMYIPIINGHRGHSTTSKFTSFFRVLKNKSTNK